MPVYLCRWPNGDCSIVSARNKEDAIIRLDEWDNAECAQLWRLDDCMIDFSLDDEGRLVLNEFGETTFETIMSKCYPDLDDVRVKSVGAPDSREQVRRAVEHEKSRLWDDQPEPKQADTELGRNLQRVMGCPSVYANRAVRMGAKRRLEKFDPGKKEPN